MAERKVPELFVEQLALDEASPERKAEVERALGGEGLTRRLEELERSDEEILSMYPPVAIAAAIEERLASAPAGATRKRPARLRLLPAPGPRRAVRLALPLAAAAAVLLAVALLPRVLQPGMAPGVTEGGAARVKGRPQLQIYREGSANPELLQDGAVVRKGDLLQIRYIPSGRAYGAIVSIDGRGAVTLHHPDSATASTRLEGDRTLDFAYELDDAPGFERFFFVTSQQSFAASVVLRSAERLAAAGALRGLLDLPKGFEQTVELLVKGE
jgi:hypothetical protein